MSKIKTEIVGTLFNVQNSPKNYKLDEVADKIMEVLDKHLATEKAYINAYTEFVDEMSVETPFDQAFETLNQKLSDVMNDESHGLSTKELN